MANKLPHIVWDTQKSKILDNSVSSELEMMFWLAETYWNASLKMQRELGGYLYERQSDGKIVTTIHKSSFSQKANLASENEEDHFKAQNAVRAALPDHYEDGAYKARAMWHTHIFVKVHHKASPSILDAAAHSNAIHASRVFWGHDSDNIETIRRGRPVKDGKPAMAGYPDFNGYIISSVTVIKFDPKYMFNAHEWRWPSREEILK